MGGHACSAGVELVAAADGERKPPSDRRWLWLPLRQQHQASWSNRLLWACKGWRRTFVQLRCHLCAGVKLQHDAATAAELSTSFRVRLEAAGRHMPVLRHPCASRAAECVAIGGLAGPHAGWALPTGMPGCGMCSRGLPWVCVSIPQSADTTGKLCCPACASFASGSTQGGRHPNLPACPTAFVAFRDLCVCMQQLSRGKGHTFVCLVSLVDFLHQGAVV